jgi:transposase
MALWCGIDLHGNNNVVAVTDGEDRARMLKRLPNQLPVVIEKLEPFRSELVGVVVESTYNWYWLVDGLMEAGYRVHLANPAAIRQYSGLKHSDDFGDACWLSHLLRIGVLREGYIYPKQERPLRDLMRKRMQLVQQRTANILSVQNQIQRNTGTCVSGHQIKQLTVEQLGGLLRNADLALAVQSNLLVTHCLSEQIDALEKSLRGRCRLRAPFRWLKTIPGVGDILALTIMLEVGEIGRFPTVGNYVSYCRCVGSARTSNEKKKGVGNVKNGNPYLAWAWVEAANFAVRYCPAIQRFHHRKKQRSGSPVLAKKATAHKLARASYYVMREQKAFDLARAFC